jgi:hypothetical protein
MRLTQAEINAIADNVIDLRETLKRRGLPPTDVAAYMTEAMPAIITSTLALRREETRS